jgi:hypothetical protein
MRRSAWTTFYASLYVPMLIHVTATNQEQTTSPACLSSSEVKPHPIGRSLGRKIWEMRLLPLPASAAYQLHKVAETKKDDRITVFCFLMCDVCPSAEFNPKVPIIAATLTGSPWRAFTIIMEAFKRGLSKSFIKCKESFNGMIQFGSVVRENPASRLSPVPITEPLTYQKMPHSGSCHKDLRNWHYNAQESLSLRLSRLC